MLAGRPLLTRALLWYGVLGAPLAFAAMHVAGVGFTIWDCNPAGRQVDIPTDLWTAVATAVATAISLGALAAAVLIFFATRGAGNAPPEGRIHFLATMGMALSPLFLFMILMGGLGAIALPGCHQA